MMTEDEGSRARGKPDFGDKWLASGASREISRRLSCHVLAPLPRGDHSLMFPVSAGRRNGAFIAHITIASTGRASTCALAVRQTTAEHYHGRPHGGRRAAADAGPHGAGRGRGREHPC